MMILHEVTPVQGETAVALGFFDGVHIGHAAVLEGAVQQRTEGLIPTVFTFFGSPQQALHNRCIPQLMNQSCKEKVLAQLGVQLLCQIDFAGIMNMSPAAFVEEVLVKNLHAKKVYCGFNYHFGSGGKADGKVLQQLCAPYGIEVHTVPPVIVDGSPVSSTRIRSCVEQGDMQYAMRLLGRPFYFDFEVVHGKKIGRVMGTPTLNQVFPKDFILPKFGVYASVVRFDDTVTYGVTNVGVKPTVGSECPLAETWMPDYHGEELYGSHVETALLQFIRPEKKFDNLKELRAAILDNAETAKKTYNRYSAIIPVCKK